MVENSWAKVLLGTVTICFEYWTVFYKHISLLILHTVYFSILETIGNGK